MNNRKQRSRRYLSVLSAGVLLAGCLITVAITTVVGVPAAHADTVPPPPPGWTTVFSDDFAGPAGSAPSSANWFYDIGTGYGTGEIEHTTSSTSNVYLDGNGHLVLKAIDNGGTWTSGAAREHPGRLRRLRRAAKLEMTASIEQPNPANGLGYWPAFWALGSPMRTGGGWPQPGRDRHDGGRQRPERGVADAARRVEQPRPRADRLSRPRAARPVTTPTR